MAQTPANAKARTTAASATDVQAILASYQTYMDRVEQATRDMETTADFEQRFKAIVAMSQGLDFAPHPGDADAAMAPYARLQKRQKQQVCAFKQRFMAALDALQAASGGEWPANIGELEGHATLKFYDNVLEVVVANTAALEPTGVRATDDRLPEKNAAVSCVGGALSRSWVQSQDRRRFAYLQHLMSSGQLAYVGFVMQTDDTQGAFWKGQRPGTVALLYAAKGPGPAVLQSWTDEARVCQCHWRTVGRRQVAFTRSAKA